MCGPESIETHSVTKLTSNVAVLIPAAGRGERMGGRRKQYRELGGESLLVRTLRLFDERTRVTSIIVALPESDVAHLQGELAAEGIRKLRDVVPGGTSRQESVAKALEKVPESTDIVLVHDAVRPFLPPDRIDAVIYAVESYGAAALALPAKDTLRKAKDGVFGETVSRDGLYRMQTPQGFRLDWLRQAHAAAREEDVEATDDVALVERVGREVRFVEGSSLNFKVTTSEDWVLAQALWHHLSTIS